MVHNQIKIIKGYTGEIAILENDTHISKWVEDSKRLDHDQNALPYILKHINEGDTVIDAGAFIGDHTVAYSKKVGENGKVIAFEPNPDAYACLEFNCKNFKNVLAVKAGLGRERCRASIELSNNAGASHLYPNGGDIQILRLDDWPFQQLNFIKIDCEGWEPEILYGAKELIKKFHPKMLIEINVNALNLRGYWPEHIFNFLDEYKYEYRNIYPKQKLEGAQYDIICF